MSSLPQTPQRHQPGLGLFATTSTSSISSSANRNDANSDSKNKFLSSPNVSSMTAQKFQTSSVSSSQQQQQQRPINGAELPAGTRFTYNSTTSGGASASSLNNRSANNNNNNSNNDDDAGRGGGGGGMTSSSPPTTHKSWLEVRGSTRQHVHAAAANNAWIAKTTRQLQDAIDHVATENGMMEEILSEPHHIVSNNDLAAIMKSVLAAASDSKSSSIMQRRKPPVLRSIARAKGDKVPQDRSGTEYLPFASSAVPYAALQLEQRDMMQRNKERQAAYDRMILDVERQQMSFQESWGNLTK